MNTSPRILTLLAMIIWYLGVVFLSIKSTKLFIASKDLGASTGAVSLAAAVAIIIGWLKGKTLFTAMWLKNLQRINNLENPKIHQFYRPRFFLFLALMISMGAILGRTAQGNVYFLVGLATLELSVGTALFISSFAFYKR